MPERGIGKFAGYKQVYSDKQLPEKFQLIYRTSYTRMRKYYRDRDIDVENPMFSMLAERICSLTATAKYIESPEYVEKNEFGLDNPLVLKEFNNLQSTLNRTMDQLMKYTVETMPKKSIKEINKKSLSVNLKKDVTELTGKELDAELKSIIGSTKAEITYSSTGEKEKRV